ncbi:MAG TPA: hypothetical protein VLW55_08410 [Burkholderiaceae bacterium]|nr:hypothetical protein [Burkholderiaceae bacterium]
MDSPQRKRYAAFHPLSACGGHERTIVGFAELSRLLLPNTGQLRSNQWANITGAGAQ